MRTKLTIAILATLTVTACGSPSPKDPMNSQYWQRHSVSSAIHMQGPKAQQALHRDIARCVSEVKELEHLNKTKNALRTNPRTDRLLDPDEKKLAGYESPEYNGYLLSEHKDYHDFDSCMAYKGWERTQYIPYSVSERAYGNYTDSIKGNAYQSNIGQTDNRIRNENQSGGGTLNH